ncbi:MAG: InlB B-repeat-containing protein, partial [Clostridia bacterium]|nr:InlB B-repeat-containing protein [Clostridia bacterium]
YTPNYIDYTVVFKNYNGVVLSTKTYHYGDNVIEPSAPTKSADNTYTYTFAGWDKTVVNCAGDTTYTATYTPNYIDYTVIFKNYNGVVLSTKTYHYGDGVVAPSTPTKPSDNTYTYTFAGWDKTVVNCAGNTTYTATYTPNYIDYTVIFKNYDGTVLSNKTYHYGDTVIAPNTPTKSEDDEYTYIFAGWDSSVVACSGNKTYIATFNSIRKYVVGDIDGVEGVTDRDAVYLLYHTFLSDIYPVNQDCDFNGDGEVNDKDAIYLLYHTFLPELYPLA